MKTEEIRGNIEWSGKSFIISIAAAILVAGIGYIEYLTAVAAVKVRPELANVGFINAFLTNHGLDWLWYHHTYLLLIFPVLTFVIVFGVLMWAGME